MKRYLAFKGERFYPNGGWYDFFGDFGTIREAENALTEEGKKAYIDAPFDWYQIIDTQNNKIIADMGSEESSILLEEIN